MDGGEANGEGGAGEQHAMFFCAEFGGEEFGLAGMGEADGLERFLGDGAGDHGGGVRFAEAAGGLMEGGKGCGGGLRGGHSGLGGGRIAEDGEGETAGKLGGGEAFCDDFRADPGRVTEGDENFWHGFKWTLKGDPASWKLARMLDDETAVRFGGVARLYGEAALRRFLRARVVVVGIGGVGSWTVEALARSGIGKIRMVDLDEICLSNVNRQLHAMDGQIGKQKTAAMLERVRAIHPACEVEVIEGFFTERSVEEVLGGDVDGVVDAIDSLRHKALLLAECRRREVAVTTCGGAGGRRDATRIQVRDLAFSGKDALLHQVRRSLRKNHGFPNVPMGEKPESMGISAVFSDEAPLYPTCSGEVSTEKQGGDLRLNCASGYGTATHVTASFGVIAAGTMLEMLASQA